MHTKVDKELRKGIMNIRNGLEKTNKNMQEKKAQRIWREIHIPISLHEALSGLTKTELDQVRKLYHIKNASSLKKAELIALLEKEIPKLLDLFFSRLDDERLNIIRKIVNAGGFIEDPDLKENQIDYFRDCGFIFTGTFKGKQVITIPQEIVNQLADLITIGTYDSIIKRNTEWIRLTQGLLYYYGTLSMSDLLKLLDTYTGEQPNMKEYMSVMEDAIFYYQQIKRDKLGYSHASVYDPDAVVKEHNMRSQLDYYPFSKALVLAAGAENYVERSDSYKKLLSYISQAFECSKEKAENIAKQCQYAARMGDSPNDVLQFLGKIMVFNSLEAVQGIMDKVVELMNNTRQWFLKGYTPNELSALEKKALQPLPSNDHQQTQQKVGRNEPCLCGSGKKYKKCCGR